MLQAELGPGYRCYVAFSAWTPYIREAVERAQAEGATGSSGCRSSPVVQRHHRLGAARSAGRSGPARAAGGRGGPLPRDPTYLDALANTVQEGLRRFDPAERAQVHVLFSAHGVPVSIIRKGDRTSARCAPPSRRGRAAAARTALVAVLAEQGGTGEVARAGHRRAPARPGGPRSREGAGGPGRVRLRSHRDAARAEDLAAGHRRAGRDRALRSGQRAERLRPVRSCAGGTGARRRGEAG